jgi:hypothetical protein
MPSGIIVSDLIKSSMRLIGAIASGETPTADEANDGLLVLNDMLENWSTETLSVWETRNVSFNTVAGQAEYTIGPAGNFNGVRPIDIDAAYCTFNGVDFPIQLINQEQYNQINLKTMRQPIIERMLYTNEFPLGVITVWPVPSQAMPLVLTARDNILAPVTLATTLTGPPGYAKALRFCLAVEMAPEFGLEASATVMQVAADSKGDYKRTNMPIVEAQYDAALTAPQVALYQRGY